MPCAPALLPTVLGRFAQRPPAPSMTLLTSPTQEPATGTVGPVAEVRGRMPCRAGRARWRAADRGPSPGKVHRNRVPVVNSQGHVKHHIGADDAEVVTACLWRTAGATVRSAAYSVRVWACPGRHRFGQGNVDEGSAFVAHAVWAVVGWPGWAVVGGPRGRRVGGGLECGWLHADPGADADRLRNWAGDGHGDGHDFFGVGLRIGPQPRRHRPRHTGGGSGQHHRRSRGVRPVLRAEGQRCCASVRYGADRHPYRVKLPRLQTVAGLHSCQPRRGTSRRWRHVGGRADDNPDLRRH